MLTTAWPSARYEYGLSFQPLPADWEVVGYENIRPIVRSTRLVFSSSFRKSDSKFPSSTANHKVRYDGLPPERYLHEDISQSKDAYIFNGVSKIRHRVSKIYACRV